MPVADGQDVGVEDDVLAGESDPLGEQGVGALADRQACSIRRRLARLVEGHDDDGGPVAADEPAWLKNSSSPSLRLMELTTPLPCRHFRPASMTENLELSIMIGTRADIGLGGDEVQEASSWLLRHRAGPSSMLTSRMLAPPSTCWRATVQGLFVVAVHDELAKFAPSR